MMSSTVLDKEKITEYISEDNKKLRITMANDVVWDMDLTDANLDDVNIDLRVDLNNDSIDESTIKDVAGKNDYIAIEIKYDGRFDFPVSIHVPTGKQHIGKVANLFWYNPEDSSLTYMDAAVVSQSGEAVFKLQHASEYVIVYSDTSLEPDKTGSVPDRTSVYANDEDQNDNDGIMAAADNTGKDGVMPMQVYIIIIAAVLIILASVIGVVIYRRNDYDDDEY